jgi:hypothetical protein
MMRGLALALLAALGCSRAPDEPPPPPPPVNVAHELAHIAPKERPRPAQLAHVTIKALGMYCEESCPMRVTYALAELHDIYELGFDLSHEAIFVSYDASLGAAKQVTKPMLAAIRQAGFDPWLAKEDWPADAKASVVQR